MKEKGCTPTEGQKQALELYHIYKSRYFKPLDELEKFMYLVLKDTDSVPALMAYVKSNI